MVLKFPKLKTDGIKKLPKPVRIAITVVVILALLFGIVMIINAVKPDILPDWLYNALPGNTTRTESTFTKTATATRGDVELTISGSGTVEPYERYEIIPEVNGEILSSPYDVGDYVEEGAVLYTFDDSDEQRNIKKSENSLEKSNMALDDYKKDKSKLNVKATNSGTVSGLDVKAGDSISQGQTIATLTNTKYMKVDVPFNAQQLSSIRVGSNVTLSSSEFMTNFVGTVKSIASTPTGDSAGAALYDVTVEFTNPGAIYQGSSLGAEINGVISPGTGSAEPISTTTIKAEIAGTVSSVNTSNGKYVTSGSSIISMTSSDLDNSIKKANIDIDDSKQSLETSRNALSDYCVTSPISGTVISRNSKAGDTIDKTNASITMMVVADISKLKFDLSVDELDIEKVTEGQEVKITCDALPNEEFTGIITKLSLEGEANNGVTTYTAEVTIFEPGNLRPSMNVDAEVVIESSKNTLRVPADAVKTMGDKHYVLVKGATSDKIEMPSGPSGAFDGAPSGENGTMPSGAGEGGEMPSGAPNGNGLSGMSGDSDGGKNSDDSENANATPNLNIPDGFGLKFVEIGVEGDTYTEIKSGINEGDQVYEEVSTSSGDEQMMPGMGGLGGMGGGPGGGMGGGPGGGGGMPGGR